MTKLPLILASQSPNRLVLLKQMNLKPHKIMPADIDETEHKGELPKDVAKRLSFEKCHKIADEVDSGYIIAADTVACVGRRTLPKALNEQDVKDCIKLISGRRHRLYTGVTIIKKENGKKTVRSKLVMSVLKFKRMTEKEIENYAKSGEGINKAGGYAVSGSAESFVEFVSGSFSNIIGLPLYETRNMLVSLGYDM